MTPTLVGPINESDNMVAVSFQDIKLHYAVAEREPESTSYPIVLSARLSAVFTKGEAGWIASAPELDALGHGATIEEARESLCDAIAQYLEYLRDDQPKLASAVADHAAFLPLLEAPRGLWFASVRFDASSLG